MGYADQARKIGVRIEEKTEVTRVRVKKGRVEAVETNRGIVSTPVLVDVAGPWGGEVARMAGIDLPVKPFRRQVFATSPFDAIPKPVPMVIDQDATFYFRGEEPFMQGMCSGNIVLKLLHKELGENLDKYSVYFNNKLFFPQTVELRCDDTDFELYDEKENMIAFGSRVQKDKKVSKNNTSKEVIS